MTIERTRQILQDKISHLSDEEVLQLIHRTEKAIDAMFAVAVKNAATKKGKNTLQ